LIELGVLVSTSTPNSIKAAAAPVDRVFVVGALRLLDRLERGG
jgi:hypothetical protein